MFEADHNGPGDNTVANVELVHLVEGGDGLHVAVGETVPRIERNAGGVNLAAGGDERIECGLSLLNVVAERSLGICPGMQLNRVDAELGAGFDLCRDRDRETG